MYVVIANFGNDSIAVIQWLLERQLKNFYVLSVDTGWSAIGWDKRISQVQAWLRNQKINLIQTKSAASFDKLVLDRNEFPSPKHQWCAGLLKGAPLNDWLDDNDLRCAATIILAKRRISSRLARDLPEFIDESDHYGGRKIWHPLYNCSEEQYNLLLQKSGVPLLNHRSLECDPCIKNSTNDFIRMAADDVEKTKELEKLIANPMFNPNDFEQVIGIEEVKRALEHINKKPGCNQYEVFDMGCGSPWGCGE